MRHRFPRSLAALLLALLAASLVAACGGGGEDEDAQGLLDKAFTEDIGSANVTMDAEFSGKGVPQLEDPVRLKVSGPYKSNGSKKLPSLDWDLNVSVAGQNISAGVVSTGDNAFVSFQGSDYEVGQDAVAQQNEQLAKQAGGGDQQGLKALGIDPANWVNDPKTEGEEEVAGVATTHVTGTVDVGRLLDDLNKAGQKAGQIQGTTPEQLTDEQRQQVEEAIKDPKFDVYVGKDDNKLRRLSLDLGFEVPEEERANANGLENGNLSFSLEFADVGGEQKIEAPSNAKPISDLLGQLGGLGGLGALGGGLDGATPPDTGTTPDTGTPPDTGTTPAPDTGATPEPGGGPGATGPEAEKFRRYAECIQKADPNDTAAFEACSKLLE